MLLDLFLKGGPIMWPLLLLSVAALAVTIERLFFVLSEARHRDPALVESMLRAIESGDTAKALKTGSASKDYVARVLCCALAHEDKLNALLRAANRELQRHNRGISFLDTAITLAPLLGLLGTVTGMIHSFGLLGDSELGAPAAITGGIAEALIATGFGLAIAIAALLPFNYLNARLEQARHEIQDAASQLEAHVKNRLCLASPQPGQIRAAA